MNNDLPKAPAGRGKAVGWFRKIWQAVRARTLLDGDGYKVEHTAEGQRIVFDRAPIQQFKPRWTKVCDDDGNIKYVKVMRSKAVDALPEGVTLDD